MKNAYLPQINILLQFGGEVLALTCFSGSIQIIERVASLRTSAWEAKSCTDFSAHVALELPCGFQPTAPTRVVWSYRLKGCSVPASAVTGRPFRVLSPFPARWLCHADEAITRTKQLSMAATARVIWLCACVR